MQKKIKLLIIFIFLNFTILNTHAGLLNFPKKNIGLASSAYVIGNIYLQSTLHKSRYLSHNLSQVNSYFNNHPQDFNSISQYVLWALKNPANQKDYERYKKLAEIMNLGEIPPYLPTKTNNSNTLINPQHEENSTDNILENPIQEPLTNIIYSPQGEQINTIIEFPIERPQNWEDFLLLKSNSQKLADNMENAGMGKKPPGYAAHHLIPATDPNAQDARDILNKHGIDINSELNGVYLPTLNNTTATQGIEHNGRHPKIYSEKINDLITDANIRGGKQEVLNELINIKNTLQNSPKNTNWSNVL